MVASGYSSAYAVILIPATRENTSAVKTNNFEKVKRLE
jgi:hypothetical protein